MKRLLAVFVSCVFASLQALAYSSGGAPWVAVHFETADAEEVWIRADDHSIQSLTIRFPGCSSSFGSFSTDGYLDIGRSELLQDEDDAGKLRVLTVPWFEPVEGKRNRDHTKVFYFRGCKLEKVVDQ